jgi:hypothetical protein
MGGISITHPLFLLGSSLAQFFFVASQVCKLVNFALVYLWGFGVVTYGLIGSGVWLSLVRDGSGAKKGDGEVFDEPLLIAVENLKTGMTFTMSQLTSRRVQPEKKLRWLKALTRQVEALVNVVEALHNIGSKSASDVDLASFLCSLESKLPKELRSESSGLVAGECRAAIRRASLGVSGMDGVRRGSVGRD